MLLYTPSFYTRTNNVAMIATFIFPHICDSRTFLNDEGTLNVHSSM